MNGSDEFSTGSDVYITQQGPCSVWRDLLFIDRISTTRETRPLNPIHDSWFKGSTLFTSEFYIVVVNGLLLLPIQTLLQATVSLLKTQLLRN